PERTIAESTPQDDMKRHLTIEKVYDILTGLEYAISGVQLQRDKLLITVIPGTGGGETLNQEDYSRVLYDNVRRLRSAIKRTGMEVDEGRELDKDPRHPSALLTVRIPSGNPVDLPERTLNSPGELKPVEEPSASSREATPNPRKPRQPR